MAYCEQGWGGGYQKHGRLALNRQKRVSLGSSGNRLQPRSWPVSGVRIPAAYQQVEFLGPLRSESVRDQVSPSAAHC